MVKKCGKSSFRTKKNLSCAARWVRVTNHLIFSEALYQLSYCRNLTFILRGKVLTQHQYVKRLYCSLHLTCSNISHRPQWFTRLFARFIYYSMQINRCSCGYVSVTITCWLSSGVGDNRNLHKNFAKVFRQPWNMPPQIQ